MREIALSHYDIVYQGGTHESKFSHELVAGAASFEAMKVFENHQRQGGQAVSHGTAKEMLAAFAGAEVGNVGPLSLNFSTNVLILNRQVV